MQCMSPKLSQHKPTLNFRLPMVWRCTIVTTFVAHKTNTTNTTRWSTPQCNTMFRTKTPGTGYSEQHSSQRYLIINSDIICNQPTKHQLDQLDAMDSMGHGMELRLESMFNCAYPQLFTMYCSCVARVVMHSTVLYSQRGGWQAASCSEMTKPGLASQNGS